jgi:hypothetical protein
MFAIALLSFVGVARAQPTIQTTLRGKAVPDECYKGLGLNGPPPVAKPPCASPAVPKVNQGYVWSMAAAADDVWFGTVPNPLCLTESNSNLLVTNPYQTDSWACEFGDSPYSQKYGGPLPPTVGDYRPPSIFVYNKTSGALTDVTPMQNSAPLTGGTFGFRASGVIGDLVLVAGPALASGGINLFAFQASTRSFLALRTLPGYNNIRRFISFNGVLYAAVGRTGGGGAILRWTGSYSNDSGGRCRNCFKFDVVGNLDADAADLTVHNGRLYATTWPNNPSQAVLAGLWMSPVLPDSGLSASDANSWSEVWRADSYEPDPVIVLSYGGGALASFDGYLYWGTMNEPWLSTSVWVNQYGTPKTPAQQAAVFSGTMRSTVMFRGKDFDTQSPTIDLVYGNDKLPVYTPSAGGGGSWSLAPNKMPAGHNHALYGASGYGYLFNAYTWAMTVWNNRLWVGTMDWSYLASRGFGLFGISVPPKLINPSTFGGDLYSFANSNSPANPESLTGVDNYTDYGIRNMLPSGGSLFLGMANNMNLLTNPNGPLPLGGWELIEATPTAP